MHRPRTFALILAAAAALCLVGLRPASTQSNGLRRITNTTEEGINLNPSVSGDGRIVAFESTEDIAGAGSSDHFRAIRANITNDPASFAQMAGSRAAAPAISQDGSRIAFASKDDPLGTNADGNDYRRVHQFRSRLHTRQFWLRDFCGRRGREQPRACHGYQFDDGNSANRH